MEGSMPEVGTTLYGWEQFQGQNVIEQTGAFITSENKFMGV